jgi:hypothetical protein
MSDDAEPKHDLAAMVENEIPLPITAGPPRVDETEIAARIDKIKWDLISKVGTTEDFSAKMGQLIRSAVDYVIDAPTLFRYTLDELDPDEKTAIGKRIERLMRFQLNLPPGDKLDVKIAGEDVDIKTTMGRNWMFSRSNHNHVNLLIAYSESTSRFRIGLAYVLQEQLGAQNRDRKQSLKSADMERIVWILDDVPYPPNFLAKLPQEIMQSIVAPKTGMKRVVQLLRKVNFLPIPRHVICSVANQKDPLRRTRSNGGARDVLWSEGILVLAGAYERDRVVAKQSLDVRLALDEMLTLPVSDPRLTDELVSIYKLEHELT